VLVAGLRASLHGCQAASRHWIFSILKPPPPPPPAPQVISYVKLVVATGARPIKLTEFSVPGADLPGLHYLRDVADADALLAAVEGAKARGGRGGRGVLVVIVGGGYIGMEVAAGLAGHPGLSTTMVFPEDRLMARLLTPQLAAFYEQYYAGKGISLVKGVMAKGFAGEGGQVCVRWGWGWGGAVCLVAVVMLNCVQLLQDA
jgi:NADPH-dependent 2,4-dienoyl-CoA reductase/sulfur reductase-like enzyme